MPETRHGGVGENSRLMNNSTLPPGNTTDMAIMYVMCVFWQVLGIPSEQAYSVEQHDINARVWTVISLIPEGD